jgi:hypothetical protein
MSKEEEYNPEKPCKPCFPFSNSQTEAFENLGTRDLVIKFIFKISFPVHYQNSFSYWIGKSKILCD